MTHPAPTIALVNTFAMKSLVLSARRLRTATKKTDVENIGAFAPTTTAMTSPAKAPEVKLKLLTAHFKCHYIK